MASESTDKVFEMAAELFALLSTPTRLRIVCALYDGERNVTDLMQCVGVSQSNISQHLGVLYRGGVVGRRRSGAQIYYRVVSQRAQLLRSAICDGQGGLTGRA